MSEWRALAGYDMDDGEEMGLGGWMDNGDGMGVPFHSSIHSFTPRPARIRSLFEYP